MIHKKEVCKYVWPRIVQQSRTSIWLMRQTYPIRAPEGFCIKLVILVNLSNNGYRGHQNCKCIYFATHVEVCFPNPGPWILHTPLVPVELRNFFLKMRWRSTNIYITLCVVCPSTWLVCSRCDGLERGGGLPGQLNDVALSWPIVCGVAAGAFV